MVNFIKKITHLLVASAATKNNNRRSTERNPKNLAHFTSTPDLQGCPNEYNMPGPTDSISPGPTSSKPAVTFAKIGSNFKINPRHQTSESTDNYSLGNVYSSNPPKQKDKNFGGYILPSKEQKIGNPKKGLAKIFDTKKRGKLDAKSVPSSGFHTKKQKEFLMNNQKSINEQSTSESYGEVIVRRDGENIIQVKECLYVVQSSSRMNESDQATALARPLSNVYLKETKKVENYKKEVPFDIPTLKSVGSNGTLSSSKSSSDLFPGSHNTFPVFYDSSNTINDSVYNSHYLNNMSSLNALVKKINFSEFSIENINSLQQKILVFDLENFVSRKTFNIELIYSLKLLKSLYLLKEIKEAKISQDQSLVLFATRAKRMCLMSWKYSFTEKFFKHSRSKAIEVFNEISEQFNWDKIIFNFTHAKNYEIVLNFFREINPKLSTVKCGDLIADFDNWLEMCQNNLGNNETYIPAQVDFKFTTDHRAFVVDYWNILRRRFPAIPVYIKAMFLKESPSASLQQVRTAEDSAIRDALGNFAIFLSKNTTNFSHEINPFEKNEKFSQLNDDQKFIFLMEAVSDIASAHDKAYQIYKCLTDNRAGLELWRQYITANITKSPAYSVFQDPIQVALKLGIFYLKNRIKTIPDGSLREIFAFIEKHSGAISFLEEESGFLKNCDIFYVMIGNLYESIALLFSVYDLAEKIANTAQEKSSRAKQSQENYSNINTKKDNEHPIDLGPQIELPCGCGKLCYKKLLPDYLMTYSFKCNVCFYSFLCENSLKLLLDNYKVHLSDIKPGKYKSNNVFSPIDYWKVFYDKVEEHRKIMLHLALAILNNKRQLKFDEIQTEIETILGRHTRTEKTNEPAGTQDSGIESISSASQSLDSRSSSKSSESGGIFDEIMKTYSQMYRALFEVFSANCSNNEKMKFVQFELFDSLESFKELDLVEVLYEYQKEIFVEKPEDSFC